VLPRDEQTVEVLGHTIRVKVARLPDGSMRAKPEFDDVRAAALATGRAPRDIFDLARQQLRDDAGTAGPGGG
jgi:uncharacterized protein (DUF111 family)